MASERQRILCVEDDPDILRIVTATLKVAGYDAVPAYGGEDALRKLEKETFDLILTDLSMPLMSGIELIQIIKQDPTRKGIPIIAVTAFVWDAMGQSAAELGCDGFLSKPFGSKDLVREVQKHLPSPRAATSPN